MSLQTFPVRVSMAGFEVVGRSGPVGAESSTKGRSDLE